MAKKQKDKKIITAEEFSAVLDVFLRKITAIEARRDQKFAALLKKLDQKSLARARRSLE